MSQDSRLDRYELFTAAAIIAAHASGGTAGFRHRDIKFFIELFSNWIESGLESSMLSIQNAQIKRFMRALLEEGSAREKAGNSTYPTYRLTRVGLLELVSRLVNRSYFHSPPQFFFLFFFIKNYRQQIRSLVEEEGRRFPHSLKLELDDLIDCTNLVRGEMSRVQRELAKLEERISSAKKAHAYARHARTSNIPFHDIVTHLERHYPYELNSQKPLSELIFAIPERQQEWEIKAGNDLRANEIWEPCRQQLKHYLQQLEKYKQLADALET